MSRLEAAAEEEANRRNAAKRVVASMRAMLDDVGQTLDGRSSTSLPVTGVCRLAAALADRGQARAAAESLQSYDVGELIVHGYR